MDVKENLSKPIDSLSYWWWPGQWLRIVWAVWTDQLWYWQNVLPQLQGKRAASFFFQALFGGGLFGLVLATATGLIVETTGIHMVWRLWVAGFVIGIIVTAMVGGAATLFNGANWGVPVCAIYSVFVPVLFSIFLGGYKSGASTPFPIYLVTAVFFTLGIGDNLYNVIKNGIKLSDTHVSGHAISYTIGVSLIARNLLLGMTVGSAFVLGAYLSGRWATCQVPDTKIRKKLANAEKTFSDSLGF